MLQLSALHHIDGGYTGSERSKLWFGFPNSGIPQLLRKKRGAEGLLGSHANYANFETLTLIFYYEEDIPGLYDLTEDERNRLENPP
ncbi:1767_t:CDS:2 [Paraglomus brasilianum]|uniref:1767_t:CDS:1 n=1 Tax=Paraglomus brasilianum TaxID=144538 RepID=A0A9N8WEC5_9GLOM|nr:1767_t:CDS:2 [Paraglomus brasilianum]